MTGSEMDRAQQGAGAAGTEGRRPAGRGLLIVMTGASGVGKGTLREQGLAGQDVF